MRIANSVCQDCGRRIKTGEKTIQIKTGNAMMPFWRFFVGLLSPFKKAGIGESTIHVDCLDEDVDFRKDEDHPEVLARDLTKYIGGFN